VGVRVADRPDLHGGDPGQLDDRDRFPIRVDDAVALAGRGQRLALLLVDGGRRVIAVLVPARIALTPESRSGPGSASSRIFMPRR
jgi:hypothetical protein